jgi:hypothetical protein
MADQEHLQVVEKKVAEVPPFGDWLIRFPTATIPVGSHKAPTSLDRSAGVCFEAFPAPRVAEAVPAFIVRDRDPWPGFNSAVRVFEALLTICMGMGRAIR